MNDDITDEERDEILKMKLAERVANMLMHRGSTGIVAPARPVLTRIPETILAEADAMAKMAGKSRNSILVQLLDVGIESVRAHMDDEALGNLTLETIQRQMQMSAEETTERENLEA